MTSTRVVVLGATGFIGRRIAHHLRTANDVIALGSAACDLLSESATATALSVLQPGDTIVMAAAIPRAIENSYAAMVKNMQMCEHLAIALARHPVRHVIYLSSIDVYGCEQRAHYPPIVTLNEQSPVHPDDYYSLAKLNCEFLMRLHCDRAGVPLTILRLPGVFGIGDGDRSIVSRFLWKVTSDGRVTVYGTGDALRDYVFVDDVCAVVNACVARPASTTLNVVSGRSFAVREIVQMIATRAGRTVEIVHEPAPPAPTRRDLQAQFDTRALRAQLSHIVVRDLNASLPEFLRQRAQWTK